MLTNKQREEAQSIAQELLDNLLGKDEVIVEKEDANIALMIEILRRR